MLSSKCLLLGRIALTTYRYEDAVYCYRPSSVVCQSVGRSVCHSSESCKIGWTDRDAVWVEDFGGPREPCIRRGPHPVGRGNFEGKERPIVKYTDTLRSSVQTRLHRSRCSLGCGLGWAQKSLDGVQTPDTPWEGAILGKGTPIVKYRDCLQWALHKRLNWSRCRLDCGLGLAQGIMHYVGSSPPFPQIDIIGAVVIVWRVRGKIIRSVLCNIVCNNCAQCNAHTYEQT